MQLRGNLSAFARDTGEKFGPKTEIRTSLANYNQSGSLCDIPLYAISELEKLLAAKFA